MAYAIRQSCGTQLKTLKLLDDTAQLGQPCQPWQPQSNKPEPDDMVKDKSLSSGNKGADFFLVK